MRSKLIVVLSTLCLFLFSQAFAETDVLPPKGNYSAGGIFIGRPHKAIKTGFLFRSKEFEIKVGTRIRKASTEDERVFEKFKSLDSTKLYVFEYVFPTAVQPKLTNTHWLITDIYEYGTAYEGASESIYTERVRKGYQDSGLTSGFISEVQRWQGMTGMFSTVCNIFVLDPAMVISKAKKIERKKLKKAQRALATSEKKAAKKKLKRKPNSVEVVEEQSFNTAVTAFVDALLTYWTETNYQETGMPFSVYSEELCRFGEDALRAGKTVQITYTNDLVELWDYTTHVAHQIKIKH